MGISTHFVISIPNPAPSNTFFWVYKHISLSIYPIALYQTHFSGYINIFHHLYTQSRFIIYHLSAHLCTCEADRQSKSPSLLPELTYNPPTDHLSKFQAGPIVAFLHSFPSLVLAKMNHVGNQVKVHQLFLQFSYLNKQCKNKYNFHHQKNDSHP